MTDMGFQPVDFDLYEVVDLLLYRLPLTIEIISFVFAFKYSSLCIVCCFYLKKSAQCNR